MDGDRKININNEGVPLNSSSAANIFLNTGKNTKVNSPNGTVIHLNQEKSSTADLGLHINTTFSVASSKKIKLLFILNFLLSVLCMIISCSVAFYYWNEISSMRRQLDTMKDQFLLQSLGSAGLSQDRFQAGALVSYHRPQLKPEREPRMDIAKDDKDTISNARKYYVEDLGEDMLLVDSSKKNPNKIIKVPETNLPVIADRELLVVHFNGASPEINLGVDGLVGPWQKDHEISSKNSDNKIQLNTNYVTINEDGLYLVYAQLVYLSRAPNCYFIWRVRKGEENKLLSSCSTGDDSSGRPLEKSQMSCSVQTVARLYKGDIVDIAQRERNRTLWLRPGYSYLGFVKLSS